MKKIVILSYPLAFDAPVTTRSSSEYRHPLWDGKTRMVSLADGEKKFEDMFNRFDVIHEHDRQTDGHRVTAKTALMHCIAR